MICVDCRRRQHEKCRGGSWCDCQHEPGGQVREDQAEPAMNWPRQG